MNYCMEEAQRLTPVRGAAAAMGVYIRSFLFLHRQKCKSTIGCATRSRVPAQVIASFP